MVTSRRRARRTEDKQERRRAILDAAEQMSASASFVDVRMADVARAARLAKGTVFLYFPTKETLFLALLEERLAEWIDELGAIAEDENARTPERAARAIAASLVPRRAFLRLLVLLQTLLEQNVPLDEIEGFKRRLIERLAPVARGLETHLPGFPPGGGVRFLLLVNALVVGLWQMADPSTAAREVIERPGLEVFRVDFERELETALAALLRGMGSSPTLSPL